MGFCNRFGIKSVAIAGEKECGDTVSADKFVSSFNKLTDSYSLDQVFNGVATGLFYKCFQDQL